MAPKAKQTATTGPNSNKALDDNQVTHGLRHGTRSRPKPSNSSAEYSPSSQDDLLESEGDDGTKSTGKASTVAKAKPKNNNNRSKVVKPAQTNSKPEKEVPKPAEELQKEHEKAEKALTRFAKAAEKCLLRAEKQNAAQADSIDRMHVDLVRLQKAAIPDLPLDDDVRDSFRRLMKDIRNWSEDWAIDADAKAILSKDDQITLLTLLNNGKMSATCAVGLQRALDGSIAVSALLHAALAHFLASEVFNDRFFLLKEIPDPKIPRYIREALWFVHQIGTNVDQMKADIWLSQTMAIIHPKGQKAYDFIVSQNMTMDDLKELRLKGLSQDFLQKFKAAHLFAQTSQTQELEQQSDLMRIIRAAATLALRLGAEKILISVRSHAYLYKKRFNISNDEMSLHPSMCADANDNRCHGRAIQMVIEPLIVARYAERENKPSQEKIWSKALVWFDIGQNQKPESSSIMGDKKQQSQDDPGKGGEGSIMNETLTTLEGRQSSQQIPATMSPDPVLEKRGSEQRPTSNRPAITNNVVTPVKLEEPASKVTVKRELEMEEEEHSPVHAKRLKGEPSQGAVADAIFSKQNEVNDISELPGGAAIPQHTKQSEHDDRKQSGMTHNSPITIVDVD